MFAIASMMPLYYIILANYSSVPNKCSFLTVAKENNLQELNPANLASSLRSISVWIAFKKKKKSTIMWKIMFLLTSNGTFSSNIGKYF